MTTINIAGLTPVDDPSYRYKMPRIVGKVEGRGNGIKTLLVNVVELGQSLNRDAPEITKFFGCELGAQTTYSADSDRAIVNGNHRDNDLQNHLSKYIENFVLCKNCKLPETHYKIKDGCIYQKCLACGSKDMVDMTHKLTAFILAQHKKTKAEEKAAGKKSDKKDKKDKKEKKEKKDKKDKSCDDDATSPVTDKKSKKKSKSSPTANDETVFGFAPGEDAEEDVTDLKAAEEGMDRFKLWYSNVESASGAAPTTQQIVDELRNIQTMASLRPADRIIIFLGAVFTEDAVSENLIAKHATTLKALAPTDIQQRHLIAAFEWLCGSRYPDKLLRYFPALLKELFDEELVEEETFLIWASDLTRNEFSAEQSMISIDTLEALKTQAAPFITWLKEAEEEDDSDEEEEGSDD